MEKVSNNKRVKINEKSGKGVDSKFEVFYFPIQGRAEIIRLVLAYAKADWKNKKVEDWAKEKTSTKGLLFKQVPMLIETTSAGKEIRIVQTGAIIRYLAKIFKLGSDKDSNNALLDSYFEGVYEIFNKIIGHLYSGAKKEDIPKNIINDKTIKNVLEANEEILESNGANGYYMGKKVTYVDLVAYGLVAVFSESPGVDKVITKEKTPNLLKVYEHISKLPEIVAYKKSEKYLKE